MDTTINILSPVHIGTGNLLSPFEYYYDNRNRVLRYYGIEEILKAMDASKLLDNQFLRNLSNKKTNQNTNSQLSTYIERHVGDINRLNASYDLQCLYWRKNRKTSEQIKVLNKPIIPGSSIKGAIMNAIQYDWVLHHYEEFVVLLKKEVEQDHNRNRKSIKIDVEKLIPKYYGVSQKDFNDFKSIFHSSFLCADISFDKMGLYECKRANTNPEKEDMVLDFKECILPEQSYQSDVSKVIEIDAKLFKLRDDLKEKDYYKDFEKYINFDSLIKVINQYFKNQLANDMVLASDLYDDFALLNEINGKMKVDNLKENECLIRIGNGTGYLFKTFASLIKVNDRDFYNKYFNQVFLPLGKSHPDVFPSTRVLLVDGNDNHYLPGVIKLEFHK